MCIRDRAAPVMAGVQEKDELRVLVLGMGTGTCATQCLEYFDGVTIKGVEIDDKITDLASKYFNLPDEVEVVTYDGRAYLGASDETFDLIMVDACLLYTSFRKFAMAHKRAVESFPPERPTAILSPSSIIW